MTCGVYKIIFKDNSFYVGKSLNIERRIIAHRNILKNGNGNYKLQKIYNEYKDFTYEILEECAELLLHDKEIAWIHKLNATKLGLNITHGGDGAASGEDNPKAKYSNEQIEALFFYIIDNPDINLKIVSSLLNISYSTVQNLCNGSTHLWLKTKYPDKYNTFLSIKGTRYSTSQTYRGKGMSEPKVISPTGEIFSVADNTSFAKSHGLDPSNFRKMLKGTFKTCKGWKLVGA